MAAPSGTVWGSIVDDYGKIGLYVSTSSTATATTVSIQVWFWSKYSATDSNNTLCFDDAASSATTSRGTTSIKTTVNSGSWSTSNQKLIYTYPSFKINRGTKKQTRSCAAKLTGVEVVSGTMTVTTTYTIPALTSYTISYNANGKTLTNTLPSSHTKYYGNDTTVSSTVPTATGYTCTGWITAAPEYKLYKFGASYTANASVVLYANWVEWTYNISYDANGGSGEPIAQTKKYSSALTLRTETPTKADHIFLGWSASKDATTPDYDPGDSYTTNADVTLYAVWELAYIAPSITNVSVYRSSIDDAGNIVQDDEGAYFNVLFSWEATDPKYTAESVIIKAGLSNSPTSDYVQYWVEDVSDSPDGGDIEVFGLGDGSISAEDNYTVIISVVDAYKGNSVIKPLPQAAYVIDVLAGGKGISFGKPAKTAGIVDSEWPIYEEGVALSSKYARVVKHGTCSRDDEKGIKIAWTYTIWSDYRVDMSGKYAISDLDCSTAAGDCWYRTDAIDPGNFPFEFTIDPNLVANYESNGYGALLWATTMTTESATPHYYLFRPSARTIKSGRIVFRVTGSIDPANVDLIV